ncbi:MAG: putative porin [Steroidobacteraceae bacterium]
MPPHSRPCLAALLIGLAVVQPAIAQQSPEAQNLNELRNTVINLLQGLVERGVLTKEQAQAMVKAAQDKASTDAAAAAQQEKTETEAGAVRVPYVPQIVKDEIRRQVAADLAPQVTRQVVQEAKSEQWGVPAALPEWIRSVKLSGDVRVRGEGDVFAADNVRDTYLNFNAVNAAGGIARAGQAAFLNSNVNRYYLVGRLRLNLDADLSSGWGAGARLATGSLVNPDSTNQVLGQYGNRYQTDVDLAYITWGGQSSSGRQQLRFWGGKFPNPFLSTNIVWSTEVTFEGLALGYRLGLRDGTDAPTVFATAGAIPVQEIALSQNDKWLYAGQLGLDVQPTPASHVRFGAAYYYYDHIHGTRNALNDNTLDYTAPVYLQKGNTLFDIRNDTDPTTNLFALAADYHLLDAVVAADWYTAPGYRLNLTADYVRNVGYKQAAVANRVGFPVPPRVTGYQAEVSFGSDALDRSRAWRAFLAYKSIERDAVLDAFNDQDFHLGGTDAKGYLVGADLALTRNVWARLRYISANPIDGPPLGIDTWQLDLNARF